MSAADEQRIYPCGECGVMRSKAEGGNIFTVCDRCWDVTFLPNLTSERMRTSLATLSHNLAIAGALCRAYELGDDPRPVGPGRRGTLPSGGTWWIPDALWYPGCGEPAPCR